MAVIDITNQCNLACTYCCRGGYKNKEKQEISVQKLQEIVTELIKLHSSFIIFQGGEPLFRRDVAEVLHVVSNLRNIEKSFDFAKEMRNLLAMNLEAEQFVAQYKILLVKAKLPLFYITTNGMIYSEEIHHALKEGQFIVDISLDAADAVTNNLTRVGSDFSKILENIRKYATDLPVQISCTITEKNVAQLDKMIMLASELNCISVKFSPVIMVGRRKEDDAKFQEEYLRQILHLISVHKEYKNKLFLNFKIYPHYLEKEIGKSVLDELSKASNVIVEFHQCAAARLVKELYIDTNLDVYGCASMKGNQNVIIGNLQDRSIKEIWNDRRRKDILCSLEKYVDLGKNFGGCVGSAFCHHDLR